MDDVKDAYHWDASFDDDTGWASSSTLSLSDTASMITPTANAELTIPKSTVQSEPSTTATTNVVPTSSSSSSSVSSLSSSSASSSSSCPSLSSTSINTTVVATIQEGNNYSVPTISSFDMTFEPLRMHELDHLIDRLLHVTREMYPPRKEVIDAHGFTQTQTDEPALDAVSELWQTKKGLRSTHDIVGNHQRQYHDVLIMHVPIGVLVHMIISYLPIQWGNDQHNVTSEELQRLYLHASYHHQHYYDNMIITLPKHTPVTIIGDIRGDFRTLRHTAKQLMTTTLINSNIVTSPIEQHHEVKMKEEREGHVLFLGSVSNGGLMGIECFTLVMALCLRWPGRLHFLRGCGEYGPPLGWQMDQSDHSHLRMQFYRQCIHFLFLYVAIVP
jgi:hypothetical protein